MTKFIDKKESENLEFKKSVGEWKEIVKTVAAFSNTNGGRIIVGVSKSGKIVGMEIGKSTIEDLTNKIVVNTDPKVYPKIAAEKIGEKNVIVIEVNESTDKLVLAFGRPFKRVGKSTIRMSKDEYERIIIEKHKEELRFDNRICKEACWEDIDDKKVKQFLKRAETERNYDIKPGIAVKEALDRLDLAKNGSLTNAAILLFAKKPQRFFLQAETRCARFKGTEPVKPFLDMKIFDGDIIEQVDKALYFVLEHIPMKVYLVGKAEREEKYEYPPDAIREAIVNAICHRDYEPSSNVQIRVFDDRIEVWGCGALPEPLIPDDLKKKHKSILRNPLIGNCFFLIKFIEKWGTGTNDIINMCLDFGLPEPIFEYIAGDFVVTFRKYHVSEEMLEKLSERQKKIVDYLKQHKEINRKDCINLLGVSKNTVIREISDLQQRGIVKRIGRGKSIRYILK
ncbi:putative DNA binding domain-containing protein [candidate division WOR-3 bacterium]|nr:putative DNA binding domain-containing protein [candidate division WOR-3 bacterium]